MFWITILMISMSLVNGEGIISQYTNYKIDSTNPAFGLQKLLVHLPVMQSIYKIKSLEDTDKIGLTLSILSALKMQFTTNTLDKGGYIGAVKRFFDVAYNGVTNTSTTLGRLARRVTPGLSDLTKQILNIFVEHLAEDQLDTEFKNHIKTEYKIDYESMNDTFVERIVGTNSKIGDGVKRAADIAGQVIDAMPSTQTMRAIRGAVATTTKAASIVLS